MKVLRFLCIAVLALPLVCHAQASKSWPTLQPARQSANATVAPMLAAARTGSNRIVAVGDYGVVLVSDDGRVFRQAQTVPVRSLLTTVQFVDARRGYAAGYDGVVLATEDAGETWRLLRATPGEDQPILSLHFTSLQHGIVVGMHGWIAETRDGGVTWAERKVGEDEMTDRHLLYVFASRRGTLLIAGEGGAIFRSTDKGASWQPVHTGAQGSFWHGIALADGTLLACGMRGHLYRSGDDGRTWQRLETYTTQSLTGMAQLVDGRVVVVGLGGTTLESRNGGKSFIPVTAASPQDLTVALSYGSSPVLLSMTGPVKP